MTNDYHFIITFKEEHMRIEQLTIRSPVQENLPSITQLSKTRKSLNQKILAPIQMITLRNIQSMRKTGNREQIVTIRKLIVSWRHAKTNNFTEVKKSKSLAFSS